MIPIYLIWTFTWLFIITLLATIFWFWMLVDVLKRKKFDDKLTWVVVLMFLNVFGAILYFFMIYKKKKK